MQVVINPPQLSSSQYTQNCKKHKSGLSAGPLIQIQYVYIPQKKCHKKNIQRTDKETVNPQAYILVQASITQILRVS